MKGAGVPIISCMDIGNDQMTNDIRIVIGPSLEILIFYELFVAVSTIDIVECFSKWGILS